LAHGDEKVIPGADTMVDFLFRSGALRSLALFQVWMGVPSAYFLRELRT
jgi:hypothetical protein